VKTQDSQDETVDETVDCTLTLEIPPSDPALQLEKPEHPIPAVSNPVLQSPEYFHRRIQKECLRVRVYISFRHEQRIIDTTPSVQQKYFPLCFGHLQWSISICGALGQDTQVR
jgi:hypothetical protein